MTDKTINENRKDQENTDLAESDENNLENKGSLESGIRFDFLEIVLYLAIAILSDILDGIWITRFFFAPMTALWLFLKGVPRVLGKNMIAQVGEFVPVLGYLPISTVAAILTIWYTNSPQSFNKIFGVFTKLGKAKKGKV